MVPACSRGPAGEKPPQAAPAAQASAASPAKKQNACALFDSAEIEAIAGQKFMVLHNIESDDQSTCELSSLKDHMTLVSVTVHWKGGKEIARTNQAAMSMAKQMLNDDDVDIEEVTGSAKVRGLADKAYYSDVMPSWILKGDVLIEIISPTFNHEKTKGIFMAVAKKALARL